MLKISPDVKHFLLVFIFFLTTLSYSQTTIFSSDFETGLGGWAITSTGYGTGTWVNGSNAAHSSGATGNYVYSQVYGKNSNNDNNTNYNNYTYIIATSPTINTTGYSNLTFDFDIWYNTETDWDGMKVEYSLNNGATWSNLGSVNNANWYNDTNVDVFGHNVDGWSGNSGGWVTRSISLSNENTGFDNNSQVKIRILFASDTYVTKVGVAFDNVIIKSDKYCSSYGNNTDGYWTGIRLVKFNTINNVTPKEDNDYSDFTSQSTTVTQGSSYDLTVKVNTDGNYKVYAYAWIDWNNDGDFNDPGEQYDLGSKTNSGNGATSNSPISITIPTTATIGSTRMRVSAKYDSYPSSCETGFDGEVEDYTINVISSRTITTSTISPASYCEGASISIPYTITGTYNSGNIFTAQLSDATGSFASPVTIGTRTATNAGTISGTIPLGTTAGSGYRIRVVSNNPVVTGSNNGTNITINAIPGVPTTTGAQICIGSTATLAASGAVSGDKYKWYNAASGGTLLKTSTNNSDNTYVTPVIAATTNYWVSILSAGGCESARTMVTATFPAVSPDSQTAFGTDTWIGHVYDGTNSGIAYTGNFTNYYGTSTEAETFDEDFGGSTTCYGISSSLGSRSIYTETFSVRYRMNSTRSGLYVVDLGSDDGSRLSVDGTLVYNNWGDQGFSTRSRVLMNLTGASSLVYDFYENGGANRVIFNNLVQVLANTLTTNTTQNICLKSTGLAISGDSFGVLPSGISKSGTGYQWAYSSSSAGPWTNITGATAATYTPSTSAAPFNIGGTFYIIRKAILSSTNNISPNPYVATNESNIATINVISLNTWNGSTSSDWNTDANWSCKVPSSTNNLDILIPTGLSTYPILSSGSAGYVENVEFQTGSTLNVVNNYLRVTQNIKLNGSIDLQGESQLLQDEGSILDVTSAGFIEIDQQGTSDNFKYNYWGSPVGKLSTTHNNAGYKISTVLRDGTDPNNIKNIDFGTSYTYADGAVTSPIKLSTYWMYKYQNKASSDYNAWEYIGENGDLIAGQGFTMKGSNTDQPEQNYTFVGKPNNGTINVKITTGNEYLIGNPYPSAIDARQFILDNIAAPTGNRTNNVIDGTLYFWDHFGGGTHFLKSYEGGYAYYNLTGGVPAIASDPSINNTGSTSSKTPGQFIPVAQGFFVDAASDLVGNDDIQFRNDQRVYQTENTTTSIFFKNSKQKNLSSPKNLAQDTFPKIFLNYNSPENYNRVLLVGFLPQATDGYDLGYDARLNETNKEDLYWKADTTDLIIQAVSTLDNNRILPLELKTAITGLNKISINSLENVPSGTEIFIKDLITGISYNISQAPMEINLDAGTYSNRFELAFKTSNTLGISDLILDKELVVFMDNSNSVIQLINNSNVEINSVNLYNYLGQLINRWNSDLNKKEVSLPVKMATGVYIVQLNTSKGVINKKIVME